MGKSICRDFDRRGDAIEILDIEMDHARAVLDALLDRAAAIHCDVSDPESVRKAFGEIRDGFGGLDIIVNNACILGKEDYEHAQKVHL